MPMIVYPGWIWVNLLCVLLLHYIARSLARHRLRFRPSMQVFKWALTITGLALVCDALSRLYIYREYDAFYNVFVFMMYFKYMLIPIPSVLFLEFLARYIGREDSSWAQQGRVLAISLCILNAIIVAIAGQMRLTLWFDSSHLYHRGPFFFTQMMLLFFIAAVVETFVYMHRKEIPEHQFKMIAKFGAMPMVGALIQAFSYGAPSMLACMTFSYVTTYVELMIDDSAEDFLTHCTTRERFDRLITDLLARNDKRPFAVLMADLDRFKDINDRFGHDEGDRALVTFATLLKDCVRMGDVVCRHGGDEFVVLLYRSDNSGLEAVVSRIEQGLEEINALGEQPYKLSVSLGGVVVDDTCTLTKDELIHEVDERMYQQKREHHRATA